MSSAGQVGGAVSPASLFSLKVSSKPNPLAPSAPVNLTHTWKQKVNKSLGGMFFQSFGAFITMVEITSKGELCKVDKIFKKLGDTLNAGC